MRFDKLEDDLGFSIYTAGKIYKKYYYMILKDFKLTYSQYAVLKVLWDSDSPMMVREISEQLHLTNGVVTPMLRRLEQDGWLSRTRSDQDERKVYVQATSKAFQYRKDIEGKLQKALDKANIDPEQWKQGVEILKVVTDKIQQITE